MAFRRQQRRAAGRPRGAVLAIAAAGVMTVCVLAVSSGQASPKPQTSGTRSAPAGTGPAWLLTRSALSQLIADPAVRDVLQSSRVCEILQPGQQPLAGVTAEPVVTFASAAQLENAVSGGQLPAGTNAGQPQDRNELDSLPAAAGLRPLEEPLQPPG